VYNKFFSGTGFTTDENYYNAVGIRTFSYPASYSDCAAVHACARDAGAIGYYGFDLHFLIKENQWQCWGYFNSYFSNPGGGFSVANSDVNQVYGYCVICGP